VDAISILIIVIALMAVFGCTCWMLYRSWGSFPSRTNLQSFLLSVVTLEDNNSEARSPLAQSNKILAIKAIREQTGMSLQATSDYAKTLPNAPAHGLLGLAAWVPRDTLEMAAEARRLLEQGNRIQAIERVRELTGMSLKEATVYVEAL
jgi:ribosomal protein L7/L12